MVEEGAMRQKANKVMMRFLKAGLVMAFGQWSNFLNNVKISRSKILKAVIRISGSLMALAVETWAQRLQHQKKIRAKAGMAGRRWVRYAMLHVVNRWLKMVADKQKERKQSEMRIEISNFEGQVELLNIDLASREGQVSTSCDRTASCFSNSCSAVVFFSALANYSCRAGMF